MKGKIGISIATAIISATIFSFSAALSSSSLISLSQFYDKSFYAFAQTQGGGGEGNADLSLAYQGLDKKDNILLQMFFIPLSKIVFFYLTNILDYYYIALNLGI